MTDDSSSNVEGDRLCVLEAISASKIYMFSM